MKTRSTTSQINALRPQYLLVMALFILIPSQFHLTHAQEKCVNTTHGWETMETARLTLSDQHDHKLYIDAKVANEWKEIYTGYKWLCPDIIENTAVLFIFPKPSRIPFHMEDVFIPLDIAFFDQHGTLLHKTRMSPEPPGYKGTRKTYGTRNKSTYVLEIPISPLSEQLKTMKGLKLLEYHSLF